MKTLIPQWNARPDAGLQVFLLFLLLLFTVYSPPTRQFVCSVNANLQTHNIIYDFLLLLLFFFFFFVYPIHRATTRNVKRRNAALQVEFTKNNYNVHCPIVTDFRVACTRVFWLALAWFWLFCWHSAANISTHRYVCVCMHAYV